MEGGTGTRSSKLFMAVALVLSGSLLLGLLAIGGLVLYRLVLQPTEVATAPEEVATATRQLVASSTPASSPLPTTTPSAPTASAPTATLVVAAASTVTPTEPSNGGTGLSSPSPEPSEMPETGFGALGTASLGLMLACLFGGARAVRHLRAQQ
jgi:hypothetical protein